MEKKEVINKIDEMIVSNNLIDEIKKECERLLNSSAIELKDFKDNFLLPKIILGIALRNQSAQYKPLSDTDIGTWNILKYF